MDLLALFTTVRRHKLIVLVVALIMIAGDGFVAFGIPAQYESQAQFVLIAPPAPPTDNEIARDPALAKVNADNPYLRLPNPSVVVDILAQRVSGDTVRRQLIAKGADRDYTISSTNAIGSGLVINIVGTGHSAAAARRTLDLVSETMKAELHEMQKINGAADKYLFEALPINPPTDPTRKVTGTLRSLIAVSAACLVLLFALISIAEAVGPRRTRPIVPYGGPDDGGRHTVDPDDSRHTAGPEGGRHAGNPDNDRRATGGLENGSPRRTPGNDSDLTIVLPRMFVRDPHESSARDPKQD
jgi:capsular polysaccharide biosynthesis protein